MVAHLVWDQRAAGSNPVIPTKRIREFSSAGRASALQAGCHRFEPCNSHHILFKTKYAGVAQLVEQLICNQQVAGSSPITSSKQGHNPCPSYMGEFPSGQRGQTVNLLLLASMVRIHPLPPRRSKVRFAPFFFTEKHPPASLLLLFRKKTMRFCWSPTAPFGLSQRIKKIRLRFIG